MNDPTVSTASLSPVRLLGRAGAILLLLALLTGGYAAAAMSGQVAADPHTALAAHVTALLGAFWIFALAWSVPHLRFGVRGMTRLAWLSIVFNYAGWLITAIKAYLKVSGVSPNGDAKNDAVFGLLNLLVVAPALVAASAWVWGFFGEAPAAIAKAGDTTAPSQRAA